MDGVIPYAIGLCGLTEVQMWAMTPAEISESIRAKDKDRIRVFRFFDLLNARSCALFAAVHGIENATPADYLTIPPETDEKDDKIPRMGDTPEQIEMKLRLFTAGFGV